MGVGLGFSNAIGARTAAREAVAAARRSPGAAGADSALAFVTSAFGGEVEAVLDEVEAELAGIPVHGGGVAGVFAAGSAADRNPGLVVALVAGSRLRAVLLEELEVDDPDAADDVADHLATGVAPDELLFIATDFAHHDATRFFAALASQGARAVGLGTSAAGPGTSMLWAAGARASRGLLAIGWSAGAPPVVDLVPRCRPIDHARLVTRVRESWVSGIGEEDALDVLRAAARRAQLAETPDSLRRLVVEVARPGARALLPIAGVDFDRAAVMIPGSVSAGDEIRIAVLDAVASRENLERLASEPGAQSAGGIGLYLSATASDPAANGEFAGEARWFGDCGVLGLASAQIYGPTGLAAGAAQPLPACSLLARISR